MKPRQCLMPNASHFEALRFIHKSVKTGDCRRHVAYDARSSFRTRSVLPEREQPTVTSEDETKTLRTRQHGNARLPLPPLMDPLAIQAKERHKQPKPMRKSGGMTEFQKELEQNPYGELL